MNLLEELHSRASSLKPGEYTAGISAVIQHIKVAVKHLERGKGSGDETAFTDAIYRTNQAFEGSLKEAYRVLAQKDPLKQKPYDIETFLQDQNVLKPRVLGQFTNYRREWRNPSTHDYRLNFDDDEALLAIVTVTAFCIVLVDQIIERVAFEVTKAATRIEPTVESRSQTLADRVALLVERFLSQFSKNNLGRSDIREAELTGALAGFLASTVPEVSAALETRLVPERTERADLLLSANEERLIVETKVSRLGDRMGDIHQGIQRVSHYMELSGVRQAILLVLCLPTSGKVIRMNRDVPEVNGKIVTLTTVRTSESPAQ